MYEVDTRCAKTKPCRIRISNGLDGGWKAQQIVLYQIGMI